MNAKDYVANERPTVSPAAQGGALRGVFGLLGLQFLLPAAMVAMIGERLGEGS